MVPLCPSAPANGGYGPGARASVRVCEGRLMTCVATRPTTQAIVWNRTRRPRATRTPALDAAASAWTRHDTFRDGVARWLPDAVITRARFDARAMHEERFVR